jgi:hypothetical protein
MYTLLSEEFVNSRLKEIVNYTPLVSINKFIDNCQSCDLVVVTSKPTNTLRIIKSKIMSLLQGGKYVSIKMVSDRNTIIGYGADIGKKTNKNQFSERDINPWIKNYSTGMLLRVHDLDDNIKKEILSKARKNLGISYNGSDVIISFFRRIIERLKPNDDEMNIVNELDEHLSPMFCSSILALIFKKCGVDFNFHHTTHNIWPSDFIYSHKTDKICRFDL